MDFVMYELLDQHLFIEPKLLDEHANLKAFQERFRSLPAIADYMKSDQFIAYPVYGPMAKFGEKSNHWARACSECVNTRFRNRFSAIQFFFGFNTWVTM